MKRASKRVGTAAGVAGMVAGATAGAVARPNVATSLIGAGLVGKNLARGRRSVLRASANGLTSGVVRAPNQIARVLRR